MGHNLAYLNEFDNCQGGMVQVAEPSLCQNPLSGFLFTFLHIAFVHIELPTEH
jgi:hypothetical protein